MGLHTSSVIIYFCEEKSFSSSKMGPLQCVLIFIVSMFVVHCTGKEASVSIGKSSHSLLRCHISHAKNMKSITG